MYKKTSVHHNFKDYLAGLLSRRDIEEMMDKACDNKKSTQGKNREGCLMGDIKSLEMKDDSCFVDRKGTDGHYVLSLNVDLFNMEGVKVHGGKTSYDIMFVVCLNLPVEIYYEPENMCLAGIIPGSNEPHLTESSQYTNHWLVTLSLGMTLSSKCHPCSM